LNEHWFVSLADAQLQIEAWRVDHNTVRPHSALGDQTPQQFAESKVGARRLTPARLNEEQNPEALRVGGCYVRFCIHCDQPFISKTSAKSRAEALPVNDCRQADAERIANGTQEAFLNSQTVPRPQSGRAGTGTGAKRTLRTRKGSSDTWQ